MQIGSINVSRAIYDRLNLPPPSQVCIVVRNLKEAASKLEAIGLNRFIFPEIHYEKTTYYGKPSDGYWQMAFSRWGEMELELACSVRPPNIYQDFLTANGEGFHHFGFDVKDINVYIEKAQRAGFKVIMSGRTSTGGFAHLDSRNLCGIILELIERKAPRV